jgi:methyltransferase (TIGR00027 family)
VRGRGTASRTAVLVCQGRAVADGRIAPGRFSDPVAGALLRDDERRPVELARAGVRPAAARDRVSVGWMAAMAEAVVPRTVAIDDAVRDAAHPQLVILGAGLDARAWRMPELAGVHVIEIDHPASQADKRERCRGLEPLAGRLDLAPVDLARDDLGTALEGAGHRAALPTTWIWEGVVPYLTRPQVRRTVALVAARSAPGSRLIVNYHVPSARQTLGRLAARALLRAMGEADPMAREPRRSAWSPAAMRTLLGRHGWRVVADDDLLAVAARLPMQVRSRLSLGPARVAVAERAGNRAG